MVALSLLLPNLFRLLGAAPRREILTILVGNNGKADKLLYSRI